MIRVLHVVGRMNRGGLETFIMNHYRYVERDAIQFDFIVHSEEHFDYEDEIANLGGRMYRVTKKSVNPIRNFLEIKSIVQSGSYSIVHRHTNSSIVFSDFLAAKLAGAKNLICHSHSTNAKSVVAHKVFRPLLNAVVTDRWACSEDAGVWLYGRRAYEVIPNAIDLEQCRFSQSARESVREELGLSGKLVLGHVGRFVESKNQKYLLKILKHLVDGGADACLMLLGTGPEVGSFANNVRDLGLERSVYYLGVQSNVSKYLSAMDVFLFPSVYEGMPVSLIEAQANGLPCVVSDSITRSAVIGKAITFVSLDSEDAWVEAALSSHEDDRVRLSAAAISQGERFDVRACAARLQARYETMARLD